MQATSNMQLAPRTLICRKCSGAWSFALMVLTAHYMSYHIRSGGNATHSATSLVIMPRHRLHARSIALYKLPSLSTHISPLLCSSKTAPCLSTTASICLAEAQAYLGSKGLSEAVAQAANMRHMMQRQPQLQPTVYSHYGIITTCCCCCHLTIIIIPHMLTFCSSKHNQ